MEDKNTLDGRQFHLKQLIGKGAFGEVYLAEQDSGAGFRRKVAIKLLHADVAKLSKDAGRRMRDEARILGRLSHRNVVSVLDLIQMGDRWAVIMEYVPGADLEEVLRALALESEHFPAPAALEVGAAVFNALHAAFYTPDDQGGTLQVIHRDIKPSNIRLTYDGEVKVLDFGVARVSMDTREAETRAAGWIGTERYMAPERILCRGDSEAGDIYAACASIVELLLGEPLGRTPVLEDEHSEFVEEVLARVFLRLKGPEEVIEEVLAWLRRGLHALPEERPSARELSDFFDSTARKLEGEGLAAFSRRFVTQIDTLLERSTQAIEGALSEVGVGTVGEVLTRSVGPNSTYPSDMSAHTFFPEESSGGFFLKQGSQLTLMAGVLGVALTLIGLLLIGSAVGLWVLNQPEGSELIDHSVAAEPVKAAPAVSVATAPLSTKPVKQAGAQSVAEAVNIGAKHTRPVSAREQASAKSERVSAGPVSTPHKAGEGSKHKRPLPKAGPVKRGAPVDRALVVFSDASSLGVHCGGVSGSGSASVRIRRFLAGECEVNAIYLGKPYRATVVIDSARTVNCSLTGESFQCH